MKVPPNGAKDNSQLKVEWSGVESISTVVGILTFDFHHDHGEEGEDVWGLRPGRPQGLYAGHELQRLLPRPLLLVCVLAREKYRATAITTADLTTSRLLLVGSSDHHVDRPGAISHCSIRFLRTAPRTHVLVHFMPRHMSLSWSW